MNAIITQEPTTSSDYEKVGLDQPSAYEKVGVGSSSTYDDVGLPTWAQPWSVLWDNFMVGKKVLGEGDFGEVRLGGVMIEGEICKAAIKKLKGKPQKNANSGVKIKNVLHNQNFLTEPCDSCIS